VFNPVIRISLLESFPAANLQLIGRIGRAPFFSSPRKRWADFVLRFLNQVPNVNSRLLLFRKRGPKRKIPPPERSWRWDSRIARFMIRYLELQPPGARRHTHTAGTTEAGLLGLLDIAVHDPKTLLEETPNVNSNQFSNANCVRRLVLAGTSSSIFHRLPVPMLV